MCVTHLQLKKARNVSYLCKNIKMFHTPLFSKKKAKNVSYPCKNIPTVSYPCKINIFAKVANFEAIFRDEEVEIEKIRWHGWKEENLNFQNIKSYCLHLMPVSHKLTSNLANFTKFSQNFNVVANEIWTFFNLSSFGT